jgi:TonB-dependent starch-binding outer membrane protein SusC
MKKFLLLSFLLGSLVIHESWAQTRTVTGKVSSLEDGTTLPGVNVLLKGTSTGAISDGNGSYSIQVPDQGGVLVFSFIGFMSQEVNVGSRSVVDVQLQPDVTQLTEIIVTGYGEQDKRKMTGAVSTVTAQKIEQIPIGSFDQILQGQAPGLLVSSGSGQPGAAASVVIRGRSSVSGGVDPLYVLDGMPIEAGTFATLNPNDFESVSVLKDAAATAIYGSRGANGVIVITTKKGKKGKTQMNYRYLYGNTLGPTNTVDVLNSQQKIDLELELGLGPITALTPAQIAERRLIDTNWADYFLTTGVTKSHEFNASGGDSKTNFYVSGNYFFQEGNSPRSDLERYTMRFNINHNATEKFRFGLNTSSGYSKSSFVEAEGGANLGNPFFANLLANPYERPYDPETGEFARFLPGAVNALERTLRNTNDQDEIKVVTNVYAEYDIIENLTFRTSGGIDYRSRTFSRLIDPTSFDGPLVQGGQGSINRAYNRRTRLNATNSLTYRKAFNENHELQAAIFNEVFYQEFESFSFTGRGLGRILNSAGVTQGTPTNNFIPTIAGSQTLNALVSYFADVNYTFKNRYYAKVGVRRDGSSRFGENNRFANFYSGSLGWTITDESFMDGVTFLNLLKARISYGTAGNQEGISDFGALPLYGNTNWDGATAIFPGIGNPDYRWETSNKFNVGVDFTLFGGKLSGTFDYYNELTTDLFLPTQLSRTSSFSSQATNIGKMRNRGVELSLDYTVINSPSGFVWNVNANATYNKNSFVDIGGQEPFTFGDFLIEPGLPFRSHFLVDFRGVNPANGEALWGDINGNTTNVFDEANRVAAFGTADPPYFGGFTNSFRYKGFDFQAFFSWVQGNTLYNNDRFFLDGVNFIQFNRSTRILDSWRAPGDITSQPGFDQPVQFQSSMWLEDGSYLRLRNVQLGYMVSQKVLARTPFRSVRAYVQGQNLLTFTKWSGLDPEASRSFQVGQYPALRQWNVGIDIGF